MEERLAESPVMVLQEVVLVPDSAGTEGKKKKENLSFAREPSPLPPACTNQLPVPFP